MASAVHFARKEFNLEDACYILSYLLELSILYDQNLSQELNYKVYRFSKLNHWQLI
jgi:hypothetical protein